MKLPFVTTSIGAVGLLGLLLVPLQGCTNLDETPTSQITPGNFFRTEAEVLAGLAGVYAQLRSTAPEGSIYDANEVSTDEIVVPTRGSDWYDNGRFTRGGADAILANMYVNAGVFTKDAAGGSGINATGYNSCSGVTVSGGQDACAAAIAAADRILNSGNYRLADSFPQNFRADNYNSPENIFVVKFIPADGLGMGITMAALHYCQYAPLTPWNGFATLAQTYNAFDAA